VGPDCAPAPPSRLENRPDETYIVLRPA